MGRAGWLGGIFITMTLALCACGSGDRSELAPALDAALQPGTVRDISAELSRLDALATPEGVDAGEFAALKTELRRLLEQYADGKLISAAPGAAHGKVRDFSLAAQGDGTAQLEWSYFNRGDYDQNSEVNVADLTPVGRWLGTNSGSSDWPKAIVSDGDGNNEVNVADVTPIGQNFLMVISGYRVLSADSATASSWTVVQEVPFAAGNVPEGEAFQKFSHNLPSPVHGLWYCVAPFNGDGQGVPSEPVQYLAPKPRVNSIAPGSATEGSTITLVANVTGTVDSWLWALGPGSTPSSSTQQSPEVTLGAFGNYNMTLVVSNQYGETVFPFVLTVKANQPPLAVLNVSPAEGNVPLSTVLDAGSSLDPDGEIVSYEWDFDGDGSYDATSGPLEPSRAHTYTEQGEYNATVRVTDDFGGSTTQSKPVSVGAALEGKWNLMLWIAADNNLADYGVEDIEELEQFGSDENVNILVGYDIDPDWLWNPVAGTDKVHFIKLVQDGTPNSINTGGDPANQSFPRSGYNSADPDNVRNFVNWCNTNFPAEHSCLVLWDHGNGWRLGGSGERPVSSIGPLPEVTRSVNPLSRPLKLRSREELRNQRPAWSRDASGVLADDSDGPLDLTSNQAIVTALGGLHFDIIAFDACNMGHVESLYEYRNLADWLVASELLVPGPGYPYDLFMQHWQQNFPASAADVGSFFVDAVIDGYGADFWDVNHAVFETAKLSALATNLASLATTVTANAEAESAGFKNAMNASFEPEAGDGVRDLLAFLDNYEAQSTNGAVDAAIGQVRGNVNSCISYFRESKSPSSRGLGIYLPSAGYFSTSLQNEYAQLPFNDTTGWLEMLNALGIEGGGGGGIQLDWDPGDRVEISWSGPSDDMDLYIYEPNGAYSAAWEGGGLSSSNLTASGDSYDIGPYEWLKAKPTAQSGPYELDIVFYDSPGFLPVSVLVRLYDSGGALKQDIGVALMLYPGYYEEGYCTLTLN